ncbi:hypothetical protein O3P69_008102 [Scylla paramamosain]|uniref:Uncharacterized protein n=1 Tax=Scylla paramamosain TaxID=85552 RepID=A0AAW0T0M3_SCYPA
MSDKAASSPCPGYQTLLIMNGERTRHDPAHHRQGGQQRRSGDAVGEAPGTRNEAVLCGHRAWASAVLVSGVARAGPGSSEMVVQQGQLQQKVMGLVVKKGSVVFEVMGLVVERGSVVFEVMDLVVERGSVVFQVMGLVTSMVQKNIQGVTVACEVEPSCRVTLVSKVPLVIFGGQHLILYPRVPPQITVRGQLGANPILKSLHCGPRRGQVAPQAGGASLNEEEGVTKDMVALSMASGVVCLRTSLVGVDLESGKPVPESPLQHTLESVKGEAKGVSSRTLWRSSVAGSPDAAYRDEDEYCVSLTSDLISQHRKARNQCPGRLPASFRSHCGSESAAVRRVVGLKDAVHLTAVPLDALSPANPTKGGAAWATALVLVLLERKFGEQNEVLATKGRAFLAGSGKQPKELLAKTLLMLDSQWLPTDTAVAAMVTSPQGRPAATAERQSLKLSALAP